MPENVKTRPRTTSRRATTPDPDTSATEGVAAEAVAAVDEQAPDAETRDGVEATPGAGPGAATQDALPVATEDAAPVAPDGAVGWADAVPWLALRWGSAPTAAEVRFAPVVWAMLNGQTGPGRTVLQMAADAELTGHTELDPNTLTRVLIRYERAGVVRSITDGRLARWSVLTPADVITQAQDTARVGTSPARSRRAGVTSRVGDSSAVTPAGGLRGLVADHLAQHSAEDFSPTQVANALGRSSGAVANALERLVEHGSAVQTSTSPRRYQRHTDPTQDGTVPDGTDLDRKVS